MYLVRKNGLLTSNNGLCLKHVNLINTVNRSAGIADNNFIVIFIRDVIDSDDISGLSTIEKIKNFLDNADLSKLIWTYDVVDVQNNDELYESNEKIFENYTLNASIDRYLHEQTQSYNYRVILAYKNPDYDKAIQDQNDIMLLYEAIAAEYEAMA